MKLLLGHKYLAYRSYSLPNFSEAHGAYIARNVAQYIYLKYTSTTSDQVPRYASADDVVVSVNSQAFSQDNVEVSYLTIDHLVTQMVAFLRQNNTVTVLVDLPLPIFLVQMLEALDFETPLILQNRPITSETIRAVVNSIRSLVSIDPHILGEVNITFAPRAKLTEDSLKEIIVSVPRNDSKRIVENNKSDPFDAILEWLKNKTTLDLRNMNVKSLECDLLSVSAQGRIVFKPKSNLTDSTVASLFSEVCAVL